MTENEWMSEAMELVRVYAHAYHNHHSDMPDGMLERSKAALRLHLSARPTPYKPANVEAALYMCREANSEAHLPIPMCWDLALYVKRLEGAASPSSLPVGETEQGRTDGVTAVEAPSIPAERVQHAIAAVQALRDTYFPDSPCGGTVDRCVYVFRNALGVAAAPAPLTAQQIEDMVAEVMGDTWADFCGDTGCFPDDFTIHPRRQLSFTPGRWAHIVGAHVAQRLAPKDGVPAVPASLTDAQAEALIEASDGHWKEDVFCIGGPELMALLRAAAAGVDLPDGAKAMSLPPFNPRPPQKPKADPGEGDDVACVKCGAVALDTGLECSECGHDNYEAVTGRPFGVNAPAAPEPFTAETVWEMCAKAAEAERHACAIVVWMTKMDAVDPGADDKGVSGWLEEAEARVKARGRSLRECLAAAGVPATDAKGIPPQPPMKATP